MAIDADIGALQQLKLIAVDWTGLPRDALHIYVGMAIFLGTAIVTRRSLAGPLPILAVAAAAVAGEISDVLYHVDTHEPVYWPDVWHDLWNTCFWPTALYLLARWTRVLKR